MKFLYSKVWECMFQSRNPDPLHLVSAVIVTRPGRGTSGTSGTSGYAAFGIFKRL